MLFVQYMLFLLVTILINSISCFTEDIESSTKIRSIADKVANVIRKLEKELETDENQLQMDREELENEKQIPKPVDHTDILQLNIGGEIITTTRQTLMKIPKAILSLLFYGRWEHKLQIDKDGRIFLDFNPIVFRHLLDQLQMIETNNSIRLYPPSHPSLVEPFKKMLRKLDLDQWLSSEKKNIITFNVGGRIITNQRTTFTEVSNSTFDTIVPSDKMINFNNQTDVFLDYDPQLFQHLINQLREESFKSISPFKLISDEQRISFQTMLSDLSIFVVATTTTTSTSTITTITSTTTTKSTTTTSTTTKTTITTTKRIVSFPPISIDTKWKRNGLTIVGGNGQGERLNQFNNPGNVYVNDNDQCIYIVDASNHRIVEWKYGAKTGQIVAGGNGKGNRMDQLNTPTDVIVDKKTDSLIICDQQNSRVTRWSRRDRTNKETIIYYIDCFGITMDNNGDLYVSDYKKNEVLRWKIGETQGVIVAGGNGKGNNSDQLNNPTYLFVDKDHSVYVSDSNNNRVMKWVKGANEGIVVAGGQGEGDSLTQLDYPLGISVDHMGAVYVTDCLNDRIMCWLKGSKTGRVIVGGYGEGQEPYQFNGPRGLSFDRQGNLYVVDRGNDRVQKFEIDLK